MWPVACLQTKTHTYTHGENENRKSPFLGVHSLQLMIKSVEADMRNAISSMFFLMHELTNLTSTIIIPLAWADRHQHRIPADSPRQRWGAGYWGCTAGGGGCTARLGTAEVVGGCPVHRCSWNVSCDWPPCTRCEPVTWSRTRGGGACWWPTQSLGPSLSTHGPTPYMR